MQPFISKLPIDIGPPAQFTTPMLSINEHHHVGQDHNCGPSPVARLHDSYAHLNATQMLPTPPQSSCSQHHTSLLNWPEPNSSMLPLINLHTHLPFFFVV